MSENAPENAGPETSSGPVNAGQGPANATPASEGGPSNAIPENATSGPANAAGPVANAGRKGKKREPRRTGILTGRQRQALMRYVPATKRTYAGKSAERSAATKRRYQNRHRRLAVEKMQMMVQDLADFTPYLTREEALAVFSGLRHHTTDLEQLVIEAAAKIAWEPLPANLRNGQGIMADGLASALEGGLMHATDRPKPGPVLVTIRLLGPTQAPRRGEYADAFRPAKVRAQGLSPDE